MESQRLRLLDPGLHRVDELADRYYRHLYPVPRLHPLEAMRLMHDGAVLGAVHTPMADDELAFDRVYASAGQRERRVLDCWYGTGGSAKQKAERLGISRSTLYFRWRLALAYFRARLHALGLDV